MKEFLPWALGLARKSPLRIPQHILALALPSSPTLGVGILYVGIPTLGFGHTGHLTLGVGSKGNMMFGIGNAGILL